MQAQYDNSPVCFDIYMPQPTVKEDACGWIYTELPKGGMFQHVSWGMHATGPHLMHHKGQQVVLHAATRGDGLAWVKNWSILPIR